MTSLWKVTQMISKLKAGTGSLVMRRHNDCPSVALWRRPGTGIDSTPENPSHGLTMHPPGTVGAGRRHGHGASGVHTGSGHGACAARSGWQSGTASVRDYDQGLGIRGQLLDWGPGRGQSLVPVPSQTLQANLQPRHAVFVQRVGLGGPHQLPAESGCRKQTKGW